MSVTRRNVVFVLIPQKYPDVLPSAGLLLGEGVKFSLASVTTEERK